MNIINRTLTLEFNLEELAKDFGYNLEVDEYEDVFHSGYRNSDLKNLDLSMPEGLEDAHKIFPSAVSMALESAERMAWAGYMRSERIEILKRCLEAIDLTDGGAEYQSIEDIMVQAKAGIISVDINKQTGIVSVEILNPEHLINTVVNGVGYASADLSATENSGPEEIKSRFHNLKDYFEVYGAYKPSDEISNNYSPDIDDEYFEEELKFRLSEMTLEEVASDVRDYIDENEEFGEAIELATKCSEFSAQEISKQIVDEAKSEEEKFRKGLSEYMEEE